MVETVRFDLIDNGETERERFTRRLIIRRHNARVFVRRAAFDT